MREGKREMKNFFDMSVAQISKEYRSRENANYYEERNLKAFQSLVEKSIGTKTVNGFVGELYEQNGGAPIFSNTGAASFRKNVSNWKNGSSFPPFVRNFERQKYVDTLLFLGIHKGESSPLEYFDEQISRLGLEKLYILNHFDFCVAVALLLEEKTGINAYTTFRQMYNDNQLREECDLPSKKPTKQFTRDFYQDFYNIEKIGEKSNTKITKVTSAYDYAQKYAHDFGRSRISAYFAYASLICGHRADSIVNTITNGIFRNKILVFEKESGEAKPYALDIAILNQLCEREASKNFFLMGRDICISCLKYQHKRLYEENEQYIDPSDNSNPQYMLDSEVDEYIDDICENIAKTESKEIIKIPKDTLEKMLSNQASISRNVLLITLITSFSSKSIKRYVDKHCTRSELASKIIIDAINDMLECCGMARLNEEISKYDYLLLSAICSVDYEAVIENPKRQYPYRDMVFYKLLDNEAMRTIEQMGKELGYEGNLN